MKFLCTKTIRLNELKIKSDHETEKISKAINIYQRNVEQANFELQWQRNHRNPIITQYHKIVNEKFETLLGRESFGGCGKICCRMKKSGKPSSTAAFCVISSYFGGFSCLLLVCSFDLRKRSMFALEPMDYYSRDFVVRKAVKKL